MIVWQQKSSTQSVTYSKWQANENLKKILRNVRIKQENRPTDDRIKFTATTLDLRRVPKRTLIKLVELDGQKGEKDYKNESDIYKKEDPINQVY